MTDEIDNSRFEEYKRQLEEHLGPVQGEIVRVFRGKLTRLPLLYPASEYSCATCPDAVLDCATPCPYAYDEYNTNGDCLAEK